MRLLSVPKAAQIPLLALLGMVCAHAAPPQSGSGSAAIVAASAPGHLVVVYRNHQLPPNAEALVRTAGASSVRHLQALGVSTITVPPGAEAAARSSLTAQPAVAAVLTDRAVRGYRLLLAPPAARLAQTAPAAREPIAPAIVSAPAASSTSRIAAPNIFSSIGDQTAPNPSAPAAPSSAPYDTFYNSPQGWAVRQAGGYGNNVPGGASTGPWTTSLGAGIRIAVLDSGVDATHPDIAPNLVTAVSLVDQSNTGEPSPCDDGSPQDQSGHGTWVASLATGAIGAGSGNVIGVAPQASLLSFKVLERLPAATGVNLAAQCEAGQPGGLLSWVLTGINDAIAQHASVIVLSLGSVIDLSTGDGAGWKAQFDSTAYAAQQAGAVLIAAVGNDGLDLGGGRYLELPAQARGVLPVVADTNPACAENLAANAACASGPITRAYYSNFGATGAVAAPGGSYPDGSDLAVSGFVRGACSQGLPATQDGLPATPGQSFGCFGEGHTAYVQAMGSSAAAPLAAGAVAILRAARPELTPSQVIALLLATATHTTGLAEPQLDLAAALAAQ